MSDRLARRDKTTWQAPARSDARDRIDVVVGDATQPDFQPQAKIQRWGNEANVSLRLLDIEGAAEVVETARGVEHRTATRSAEFYPLDPSPDLPDGGFEIEVTLHAPPATNQVRFSLVDKAVEYHYQRPLANVEPDGSTWERRRLGVVRRPAHVSGSYAVYAATPKRNVRGRTAYRTGKIGHIYRPRIEDSAGHWTWGDLSIADGVLTVTIPETFLATAQYPIRHAAGLTFGYDTVGGSTIELISSVECAALRESAMHHTASAGDRITRFYVHASAPSGSVQMAAYAVSGGVPTSRLAAAATVAIATTPTWNSSDAVSQAMSEGSTYTVALGNYPNGLILSLDDFGTNAISLHAAGGALPSSWSEVATSTERISIYAEYEPSPTVTIPRIMHHYRQMRTR